MGQGSGDESKGIQSSLDKYKKRAWRMCKCGTGWAIFGILFFIVGIIFLVYFGKYWGDDEHWEKGLAYAGVALILIGILVFAIGIFFCVILYCVYRRINGPQKTVYKAPSFPPGEAPYPQQPPYQPVQQVDPAHNPQHQPGTAPQDVNIEVQDRTHF